MKLLDFQNIRTHGASPQDAFEELVCQIARRNPPNGGSEFRRIEGSGGDGGIEGYWNLKNKLKVGYQAKFHLRSGDIDWQKIDQSIDTALGTHKDLTKYVVAVPCNFTERSGKQKRGSTAWGRWDVHKKKWLQNAKKKIGRSVEFVPWTASDLSDLLISPSAVGLRAYWFGEIEFPPDWFINHMTLVRSSLDERYHPEDHVDVGLQRLFSTMSRDGAARSLLRERIRKLKELSFPSVESDPNLSGYSASLQKSRQQFSEIRNSESVADIPVWQAWNLTELERQVSNFADSLQGVRSAIWDLRSRAMDESKRSEQDKYRRYSRDLEKVLDAAESLQELLKGRCFSAEAARVALVEGRAGAGKSHLLASVADNAIATGQPVVMLLGQQLRSGDLWPQILNRLGIRDSTPDTFLGALDAAAEAARVRGLILVDALNEGGGAALWHSDLAAFLDQVRQYKNLACVVSCRSEYVQYIVPPGLLKTIDRFEARGFVSVEEQEDAARVYLDKRGISRPATPWLAPEFTNPLFLRSCCTALSSEQKSEFPTGLRGVKEILSFYVSSAARHLGAGRDGSDDLVAPTKRTLVHVAREMAQARADFVSRSKAERISTEAFENYAPPVGLTWLELLQRNGLLRFDPDPLFQPTDSLLMPSDVVRFSFQRFQDHLMADALLSTINDIKSSFVDEGDLAFLLDHYTIAPRWNGLFQALCIAVPEKFKTELIDELPGHSGRWWPHWRMSDAYRESFRWRAKGSFTRRTLELFNALEHSGGTKEALLIEFASSADHPWNAEFLHQNLARRPLAVRDATWTVAISRGAESESHPVHRLLDWCLHGQSDRVQDKTRWLASIAVAWILTSTNRPVRDVATKALSRLLIAQPGLLPKLLHAFADADDIYIHERLWAAAYGAACFDPSEPRLRSYAAAANESVFALSEPPKSILLRDYARGIVELANTQRVLPNSGMLDRCRPPYRTKPPRLNVSEVALEKRAEKAGGKEILLSCVGLGDFGSYEINSTVDKFVAVSLSEPKPYSSHQLRKRFEKTIINADQRKKDAYKAYNEAQWRVSPFLVIETKGGKKKQTNIERKKLARNVTEAASRFLALLSATELAEYLKVFGERSESPPAVDREAAQRWVANRAYNLGWTRKRFDEDERGLTDYSRRRPRVERVGKKYQWIALDELLCSLADNFWLLDEFGDSPKVYDLPPDIGFVRDIDPTVMSLTRGVQVGNKPRFSGPIPQVEPVPDARLTSWPFAADPGKLLPSLIQRPMEDGVGWLPLYEHRHAQIDRSPEEKTFISIRQEAFHILMATLVRRKDQRKFVEYFRTKKSIDVMTWSAIDETDGAFLLELPWRSTWNRLQWEQEDWRAPPGIQFARPVWRYVWESHLDGSLPEGMSTYVLAPWLADALRLSPWATDPTVFVNTAGTEKFFTTEFERGDVAAIETVTFDSFLKENELACVWLFVAERNAFPPRREDAVRQRSEGIAWFERSRLRQITWSRKE